MYMYEFWVELLDLSLAKKAKKVLCFVIYVSKAKESYGVGAKAEVFNKTCSCLILTIKIITWIMSARMFS